MVVNSFVNWLLMGANNSKGRTIGHDTVTKTTMLT